MERGKERGGGQRCSCDIGSWGAPKAPWECVGNKDPGCCSTAAEQPLIIVVHHNNHHTRYIFTANK